MKSCVIRRRFHTSEAVGTAVTVNLEPGFGIPKACLVMYTETSAATDSFDTTTGFRTVGIGMIGSTSSNITSTLRYQSVFSVMADNSGSSDYRRQNSNSRFLFATNTSGGTTFWQASSATFTTDVASFTFTTTTPQTNGHLDCILTFFGGDDLIVGIGTHLMPGTAGGSNSFTGFSFQPDILIAASPITAINAGLVDDFRFCFGAAQRTPAAQYSVYLHGENSGSGNMDQGAVTSNSAILTYATTNGVGPYTMTIDSFDTNGFTMTSSDSAAGSNNFMMFLGLKSSTPTDFSLQSLSTPTGTGNSFTGVGATFVPKSIIGAATNCTTYGTRLTTSPGADSIQLFGGNRSADSLYWDGPGTITTNTAFIAVIGEAAINISG